ncbi:MAG: histone deacetylase [Desulfobacterales bacterium]|jgi:acetoin utilization deacetylase AcuC-like enzyme|nr:histone deacetylase [Desulfobacterales bacterium]
MGLKVGIARDERFLEHKTGHFHPEHPNRLTSIYRMIDQEFSGRVIDFKPEPASLEHIERVHTPGHIRQMLKTAELRLTSLAPDTPVSATSYLAAWLAVGACLKGVDCLIGRECDAFFALVRPPGHHALPDRAGGFCLFNNIAIAALYAIEKYKLERILVIDWDIHHGNGIHDFFYEDRRVLYLSTHDLMLYPYSGEIDQTGKGTGEGYTINIPLDRSFSDDDAIYLYQEILTPLIRNYKPQLIMIAAGFDAHADDPIGRSRLTEKTYAGITALLVRLRNTYGPFPLLFSLEGGYDQRSLTQSVKAVLAELINEHETESNASTPSQDAIALVKSVQATHARYGVLK